MTDSFCAILEAVSAEANRRLYMWQHRFIGAVHPPRGNCATGQALQKDTETMTTNSRYAVHTKSHGEK